MFGFFTRSGWQIVIGLVVLVVYGSVLWGAVPVLNVCGGVSWQGHLCGGIAGVLAAYLLSSPERKARAQQAAGATVDDMSNALAPIGVFDSGVGGLTVARAIIDQLPDEDIVYVGDTGNGPYGPLTIPEIRAHALAIGDDLVDRGVKALVIACNSASVGLPARCPRALRRARRRGDPARGAPGRRHHPQRSHRRDRHPGHRRLAAPTRTPSPPPATPRSPRWPARGSSTSSSAAITSGRQVLGLAEGYLEPLQRADVDTLVLGCTHYPLLSGLIQLAMGDAVTLVSSAEETAKEVLRVLTERDLLRPHERPAAGHPRFRSHRRSRGVHANSRRDSWVRRSPASSRSSPPHRLRPADDSHHVNAAMFSTS